MLKKMLLKAAATSAAVGGLFAASLVATPAVVATAPEIRTVACDYPAEAKPSVVASVTGVFVPYGYRNSASATVSGIADTSGSVSFLVKEIGSWRVVAEGARPVGDDGVANFLLDRTLPAGRSYAVTAHFRPADPCAVQSGVDTTGYTVFKRKTRTVVDAPNRRATQRPVVTTVVRAAYQNGLGGKIRVVITKKGKAKALRATTVKLVDRSRTVSFKRLRPGLYTAKVRYLGNRNYAASNGADDFRIRR